MSFYHARVHIKGSWGGRDEIAPDLTYEQAMLLVIEPYRNQLNVAINGKEIPRAEIEYVRVTTTDENLADYQIKAQNPESGSTLEQIRRTPPHLGKDVTNELMATHEPRARQRGPSANTEDVFVVHGRNEAARLAMFAFLRALSLHPLEWQELVAATEQGSPYIGDILDVAFSRAHAIVVLMTPDDEARLREQFRNEGDADQSKLKGQARLNVIFEAGRAFDRNAQRTVLVEIGDLRPFSDVAGRHTIRFNGSAERRHELAQRLRSAGCPVNTDGNDWLSAGDFAAAIELAAAVDTHQTGGSLAPSGVPPESAVPAISSDAAVMLLAASGSPGGRLLKVSLMSGTIMQAGAESFGELGNPRSEARWKSALDELLTRRLMRYEAGDSYEVTHDGFEFADSLKAKQ